MLFTSHDLLFFWIARMRMFGTYAMDGQPSFKTVALHGMVGFQHGKKISKTLAMRSTRYAPRNRGKPVGRPRSGFLGAAMDERCPQIRAGWMLSA
ncbi:class I tRNA ligase family protein [Nocardia speluncae]|uniref:class I tRNA ligase family protein n=1 Tax=Nocardia speluncae TaxID=419477 RepID=UPI001FE07978|nr:class I tRNA ligase family protein [Nocardia speluncae]